MEQKSLQVLPYTKRDSQIFYGDLLVGSAVASSFVDLGNGYGKDIFNVFFAGQRILKANVSSFQVVEQKVVDKNGMTRDFENPGKFLANDSYNFYVNGKAILKKKLHNDNKEDVSACSIL